MKKLKVLGLWFGFENELPLKREGIARVFLYLVKYLLKNYSINFEVWCYSINRREVEDLFSEILIDKQYAGRLQILTEESFVQNDRKSRFKYSFSKVVAIFTGNNFIYWKYPCASYGKFGTWNWFFVDLFAKGALLIAGFIAKVWLKFYLRSKPPMTVSYTPMVEMSASKLPGEIGEVVGGSRIADATAREGFLTYGPYIKLSEGVYEFIIEYAGDGHDASIALGRWDVSLRAGQVVIHKEEIFPGNGRLSAKIYIEKEYSNSPIEIRIYFNGLGRLEVKKMEIGKEGIEALAESTDLLAASANMNSNADIFFIYIVTLVNALQLDKKKLVFLPDLVTLEFYDYFVEQDPGSKEWIEFGKNSVKRFSEGNAYFCGISDYGITGQLLKFIPDVKKANTTFIYLASMMPENVESLLLERKKLLEKFKIRDKFIYFPSQIRGYKNLSTLIKALHKLNEGKNQIDLVLTGDINADRQALALIKEYGLRDRVKFVGSLTEIELFSLYKYAELTVSPSLFEGGFPLQGLESLLMDTPVVLGRIPVTVERLAFEGFNPNDCGITLYEPKNETDLARKIEKILSGRQVSIKNHQKVREAFVQYTWNDVSRKYYELFEKILLE